jgi:sRNA-binding protein
MLASAASPIRDAQRTANSRFEILRVLEDLSPAFRWPRQPLAVGISRDILELLRGEFPPNDIKAFMAWYCGTHHYLEAVATGHHRLTLDGTITEPPTDQQREFARNRLARRNRAT